MLQKALETNGCLDWLKPKEFNPDRIKQDIIILEKQVSDIRLLAFSEIGVNINHLQAKLTLIDAMKINLKSLELLNQK